MGNRQSIMRFKLFAIICLFLFSFFFYDSVFAIGIGANPSSLDLEMKLNEVKESEILVYNISRDPEIFQIFPDELNDWIKVEPDNFRLEAGETKKIKIIVSAKKEGRFAIDLSIVANPLDRQNFSIGSGLKIPLRLNIKGQEKSIFLASVLEGLKRGLSWLLILISIILIIFFLMKYFISLAKNQKKI